MKKLLGILSLLLFLLSRFVICDVINTIAGSGTYSFSGDGGAATSATMRDPYGVAVDSSGVQFYL